jgi:hypothetical protein
LANYKAETLWKNGREINLLEGDEENDETGEKIDLTGVYVTPTGPAGSNPVIAPPTLMESPIDNSTDSTLVTPRFL